MALNLKIDFSTWLANLPKASQALAEQLAPSILAAFNDPDELRAWGNLFVNAATRDQAREILADRLAASDAATAFLAGDETFAKAGNDAAARKQTWLKILEKAADGALVILGALLAAV